VDVYGNYNNNHIYSKRHKMIINATTNKPISIVSSDYVLVENEKVFNPLFRILQDYNGSVRNIINTGNKFIVSLLFKDYSFEVEKDDRIAAGVSVINSYDGSTKIKGLVDAVRIICVNGLIAPMFQFMNIDQRHYGSFNLDSIGDLLYKSIDQTKLLAHNYREMTEIFIPYEKIEESFRPLFPIQTQPTFDLLLEKDSIKNEQGHYQLWNAYNAGTYVFTHLMPNNITNYNKRISLAKKAHALVN